MEPRLEELLDRLGGPGSFPGISASEGAELVGLVYAENRATGSPTPLGQVNFLVSLRDYFAAEALKGIMLRHDVPGYDERGAVNEAFNIADMMLERRKTEAS